MHFHIITIFPQSFESYFDTSILKRASADKKIKISFYNPIDFLKAKERIDDRPYGGGPGMVMRAEPVIKAIQKAIGKKKDYKIVFFTPSGETFTTQKASTYSHCKNLILVCGRYEGIDARVLDVFECEKISIGDYVLTGGELPAMIVTDCVARQVKGVLGAFESLEESRSSSPLVYTRPEILKYKGASYGVPEVLLGGNHKEIDTWRENQRL